MKRLYLLGAFLFSGFLSASSINNIVVFGDSLSDNGNLYAHMQHRFPPSPPYIDGRFADGPVWVEYLSQLYFRENPSKHLQDFAFGGAMVSQKNVGDSPLFTLEGQVNKYLATERDEMEIRNSLYILWIGSNNYLGTPVDKEHQLVKEVNGEITRNLNRLATIGAKHILVVNLPDIGKTPFAAFLDTSCPESDNACMSKILTHFTNDHNKVLIESITQLQFKFPNINWMYYDMNHMFIDVMQNPANYHLNYVDKPCYQPNQTTEDSSLEIVSDLKPKKRKDSCEDYLFYDLLHPTTSAHKIIAEKIKDELESFNVDA